MKNTSGDTPPAYWKRGLKHGVQYAVKQLHFNDKGSALAWVCDYHPGELNDAIAGWSDETPIFGENIWGDIPCCSSTLTGTATPKPGEKS